MVTLQLVSIYDMACAAVLAAWVGISGLWVLRTIGRVITAFIDRSANRQKVYDLNNQIENLQYDLSRARGSKRRKN